MTGKSITPIVEESIKSIKENPLYYASLGSKELFHSNFLAWIWETNNECFKEILGIAEDINLVEHELKREKLNIDLTIFKKGTDDVVVAIENKVKDVPIIGQIEKYSQELEKYPNCKNCKKILLTIVEPRNDIKNLTGWDVVQYNDVAQKLREFLQQNSFCNHKIYLEDYEKLISDLSKLINDRLSRNENYWFNDDKKLVEQYEDIRLEDTIKKYKASILASDVVKHLKTENIHPEPIEHEFGINHKTPCVTFKHFSGDKKITLMIQIEGKQYRRAIEVSGYHEADKRKLEDYIKENDKYQWLFKPEERHNKKMNIYTEKDRTKGTFIYSYKKIVEKNDKNIGEEKGLIPAGGLVVQIIDDIKKSIRLLKRDEYINSFLPPINQI